MTRIDLGRLPGLSGASAFVLLIAATAQADGLNQVAAGGDQYAIAVQDSVNGNLVNYGSGNDNNNSLAAGNGNDNSTNDSQIAALDSQAAGNDANIGSHNTLSEGLNASVNESQSADRKGQAAGNDAISIDADRRSQVAMGDAVQGSHNDASTNIEVGPVALNVTSLASAQLLEAAVTDNKMVVFGGVTSGHVFSGSGNFGGFAGLNSQNINSGVMSVGLNASAVNVHGQVTIGN